MKALDITQPGKSKGPDLLPGDTLLVRGASGMDFPSVITVSNRDHDAR